MDAALSRKSPSVSLETQIPTKPRILILEDDQEMGKAIESALRETGFGVDWTAKPEQALHRMRSIPYDLILLDWKLPGQNGDTILSLIRKFSNIPVIIETGNSDLAFRLAAFELGADDILIKPFGLGELRARVGAILRRTKDSQPSMDIVRVGDVLLNLSQNSISRNGKTISLDPKEMEFVRLLLQIPGKPVSKEVITRFLFSHRKNINPSRCDVFIFRIRKKLGQDFIRCRHGDGYFIDPLPASSAL